MGTAAPASAVDRRRQVDDDFFDLVLSDPDLLELEFAAVVAGIRGPSAPAAPAGRTGSGSWPAASGRRAPDTGRVSGPDAGLRVVWTAGRWARSPPPGRTAYPASASRPRVRATRSV